MKGVYPNRAFTLIELLVVIAIIGILSAVILASLSVARDRAQDAAVRSNLATVRTLTQQFHSIEGCYSPSANCSSGAYSGNCLTATTAFRMTSGSGELRDIADKNAEAIDAAYQAGGSTLRQCRLDATRQEYLIAVGYRNGGYRCIDSVGAARDISELPASGVVTCPEN